MVEFDQQLSEHQIRELNQLDKKEKCSRIQSLSDHQTIELLASSTFRCDGISSDQFDQINTDWLDYLIHERIVGRMEHFPLIRGQITDVKKLQLLASASPELEDRKYALDKLLNIKDSSAINIEGIYASIFTEEDTETKMELVEVLEGRKLENTKLLEYIFINTKPRAVQTKLLNIISDKECIDQLVDQHFNTIHTIISESSTPITNDRVLGSLILKDHKNTETPMIFNQISDMKTLVAMIDESPDPVSVIVELLNTGNIDNTKRQQFISQALDYELPLHVLELLESRDKKKELVDNATTDQIVAQIEHIIDARLLEHALPRISKSKFRDNIITKITNPKMIKVAFQTYDDPELRREIIRQGIEMGMNEDILNSINDEDFLIGYLEKFPDQEETALFVQRLLQISNNEQKFVQLLPILRKQDLISPILEQITKQELLMETLFDQQFPPELINLIADKIDDTSVFASKLIRQEPAIQQRVLEHMDNDQLLNAVIDRLDNLEVFLSVIDEYRGADREELIKKWIRKTSSFPHQSTLISKVNKPEVLREYALSHDVQNVRVIAFNQLMEKGQIDAQINVIRRTDHVDDYVKFMELMETGNPKTQEKLLSLEIAEVTDLVFPHVDNYDMCIPYFDHFTEDKQVEIISQSSGSAVRPLIIDYPQFYDEILSKLASNEVVEMFDQLPDDLKLKAIEYLDSSGLTTVYEPKLPIKIREKLITHIEDPNTAKTLFSQEEKVDLRTKLFKQLTSEYQYQVLNSVDDEKTWEQYVQTIDDTYLLTKIYQDEVTAHQKEVLLEQLAQDQFVPENITDIDTQDLVPDLDEDIDAEFDSTEERKKAQELGFQRKSTYDQYKAGGFENTEEFYYANYLDIQTREKFKEIAREIESTKNNIMKGGYVPEDGYELQLSEYAMKQFSSFSEEDQQRFRKAVQFLINGYWKAGVKVKKLQNVPVLEARMDRGRRILFKLIKKKHRNNKNNESYSNSEDSKDDRGEKRKENGRQIDTVIHIDRVVKHKKINSGAMRVAANNSKYTDYDEAEVLGEVNSVDELQELTEENSFLNQIYNNKIDPDQFIISGVKSYRLNIEDLKNYLTTNTFPIELVLSTEQQELREQEIGPLLLNGAAGTGKTTILIYRYVDQLRIGREPLLVTYSDNLHDHMSELLHEITSEIPNIDKNLFTFDGLTRSIIGEKAEQKFPQGKKVTFVGFRQFLETNNLNNEFESTQLWEEIRAIIKGACLDYEEGIISLKDYREEGRKRSLFPKMEDRDQAYSIAKHYHNWVRSRESKHWDELDLAQYVFQLLERSTEQRRFTSLLCDEVQDLAEVQYRVLFRLVEPEHIRQMFFAGDTQQIINPSLFRWDDLKRSIYEYIDYSNERKGLGNVYNLRRNFRATYNIIEFGNAFLEQKWELLGNPNQDKPQKGIEGIDTEFLPTFLLEEETRSRQIIQLLEENQISTKRMLIVSDKEIKTNISREIDNLRTELVHTIEEAKGMEFDATFLFNILTNSNINFRRLNDPELQGKYIRENWYSLRLLMNRVYVAITRSRRHIAIFESDSYAYQFWQSLTDQYMNITPIQDFYAIWEQPDNKDDWLKEAVYFYEQNNLQAARECFKSAGRKQEKDYCQALIYRDEERYLAAAKLFFKLGLLSEAAQCYEHPNTEFAHRIYQYLQDESGKKRTEAILHHNEGEFSKSAQLWYQLDKIDKAIQIYEEGGLTSKAGRLRAQRAEKQEQFELAAEYYKQIGATEKYNEMLFAHYDKEDMWEAAAELAEKSEAWDRAARYYEQAGTIHDRSRCLARAAMEKEDYETAIDHLVDAELFDEAATYCVEEGMIERAAEIYNKAEKFERAAELMEDENEFERAIEYYELSGNKKKVEELSLYLSQQERENSEKKTSKQIEGDN